MVLKIVVLFGLNTGLSFVQDQLVPLNLSIFGKGIVETVNFQILLH